MTQVQVDATHLPEIPPSVMHELTDHCFICKAKHTHTHTVLRQLTYLNRGSYCSEKNTFLIDLRTILNFQFFGIFFQAEGMQKICKIQVSIRGIVKKKKASFIHTVDLLF